MFHYFSLEEVYQYAERLGYDREDVEVRQDFGYDYDKEEEFPDGYEVSFGHEDSEMWVWEFDSLEEPAWDYEHIVWED